MIRRITLLTTAIITAGLMGCDIDPSEEITTGGTQSSETLAIESPEASEWLSYGRDYSEQRFVPAADINIGNVERLGLVFSKPLGAKLGVTATPLVIDGRLIFPLNWNVVVALDALTGEEVWRFDPQIPRSYTRSMGGASSRGVASYGDKLFVATMDGQLVAIRADDGEELWRVDTFDGGNCDAVAGTCFISGAPRVAAGKVFIGFGGAENNARGYMSAYDVETGERAWRFFVVPDGKVEPEHPEMQVALATWGASWKNSDFGGGGTVWDSMVYDGKYDQLIIGTGNGGPMFSKFLRAPDGGDLLYLASIIALDVSTGKMNWYYQQVPGEQWDYTATQSLILAELSIEGASKDVVMQAPKNGYFYVIDRESGALLKAEAFADVTWSEGIDKTTGRPRFSEQANYDSAPKWISPGGIGAANWQPSAYNPDTGLVYISGRESVHLFHLAEEFYEPGAYVTTPGFPKNGFDTVNFPKLLAEAEPPPRPMIEGRLKAFDPEQSKMAWEINLPHFWNGGVLTTAGNLVFMGGAMGDFNAYDARTGDQLWSYDTYGSIVSAPVSYVLGGKQYVAVITGTGMATSAFGFNGPTASYTYGNESQLFVFALDADSPFTPPMPKERRITHIPEQKHPESDIDSGNELFHTYCSHCHGSAARSSSVMPDLRHMTEGSWSGFNEIVQGGLLVSGGMASFADVLTPEETQQIKAYLVARVHEDVTAEELGALDFRGGI